MKKCVSHIWISGKSCPTVVLKYGSFSRLLKVCAYCGKIGLDV